MTASTREVTITRECTHCYGCGEIEIEIVVDGEFEGADPDVGIMSGGYVVNGATIKNTGETFELTKDEERNICEEAELEYAEDSDVSDE